MNDQGLFPVTEAIAKAAHADDAAYRAMCRQSVDDSEGFWAEQAKRFHPQFIGITSRFRPTPS